MSDKTQPRPELAEIQNLPVAELSERLEGLTAEDLAQLRDLENASEKPRAGALSALDAAAKALGEGDEVRARQSGDQALANTLASDRALDARADAKAPAWQAPDYDGPLTIPQAEWRRHNIKPVARARTK